MASFIIPDATNVNSIILVRICLEKPGDSAVASLGRRTTQREYEQLPGVIV